MPKKQANTESIQETLNQISKDYGNIKWELDKIRTTVNTIETYINEDLDQTFEKIIQLLQGIVDKQKKIEEQLTDLFNDHSEIMERLEKISKSLYWHRQTTENQQGQYRRNYQGNRQNTQYRKGYKKQYRRYNRQ